MKRSTQARINVLVVVNAEFSRSERTFQSFCSER